MRKPYLAANWKMNLSAKELENYKYTFLAELSHPVNEVLAKVDIVFAVPSLFLAKAVEIFGETEITIAAQNLHWEDSGAFTGENSTTMLKEAGSCTSILGHSERRKLFLEADSMVHMKFAKCLEDGVTPILCIGETREEREQGQTLSILATQLKSCLTGKSNSTPFVVAYEPVWAIGTGLTASKEQAQEAHSFVRDWLNENINEEVASNTRILYGGSMKPEVTEELLNQKDIDGGLIGGASLDPVKFAKMANIAFQITP